jgi:hypothetical protein
MTLEELKAAMEAAKAKADAAPGNAELKKAFDEAKSAYDNALAAEDESEDEGGGDVDESKLDEKTKSYIAKLRKEAAGHRTKAKDLKSKLSAEEERRKAILKAAGIEDESDDPVEKFKAASQQNDTLTFRNAILESAVQNGISGEEVEFFEFLVSKSVSSLEEGDELSDEQMAEIVKKVKGKAKGAANTTVGKGGKEGSGSPNPDDKGDISLDQFSRMTMMEKSKLYVDNPGLYNTLMKEAKEKKRLI